MPSVDNPGVPLASIVAVLGALTLVWLLRYRRRLARITDDLVSAEEALDAGEVDRARELVAPLMSRYPHLAVVQEVAADVLYWGGDPLSAASLWERAMKQLGPARIAPRLAGAYAALNRPGDARRVASLVPDDATARLALAWCELAAVGGDRERGAALLDDLRADAVSSVSYDAMRAALRAIARARAGDVSAQRDAIEGANARAATLVPTERAFIGYLVGIAQREANDVDAARATWSEAIDIAPETIGSALARRERSHLVSQA